MVRPRGDGVDGGEKRRPPSLCTRGRRGGVSLVLRLCNVSLDAGTIKLSPRVSGRLLESEEKDPCPRADAGRGLAGIVRPTETARVESVEKSTVARWTASAEAGLLRRPSSLDSSENIPRPGLVIDSGSCVSVTLLLPLVATLRTITRVPTGSIVGASSQIDGLGDSKLKDGVVLAAA